MDPVREAIDRLSHAYSQQHQTQQELIQSQESELDELRAELSSLRSRHAQLQHKYQHLHHSLLELAQFKQQIKRMVEASRPVAEMSTLLESTQQRAQLEMEEHKMTLAKKKDPGASGETLHLTPFKPSTPTQERDLNTLLQSPTRAHGHRNRLVTPARTATRSNDEDDHHHHHSEGKQAVEHIQMLYKQIRALVSPGQFQEFSQLIARFNAGQLDASMAVERLRQLVPNEALVQAMSSLIERAASHSD